MMQSGSLRIGSQGTRVFLTAACCLFLFLALIPAPAHAGSCEGHCDSAAPVIEGEGQWCFCDEDCERWGDCCPDVCTFCTENTFCPGSSNYRYGCSDEAVFGQPGSEPDAPGYHPVYFLSDFALFSSGQIALPFEDFTSNADICSFRWWGVEMNTDALECDGDIANFAITVLAASEINADFSCEFEVMPVKTYITDVQIHAANTTVLSTLPLYRYDVPQLDSCCELPPDSNGYYLNVRSIGETACHFGWVNTLAGDGTFSMLDPWFDLTLTAGNLAFCVTPYVAPPEGEGEIVVEGEGEVLPEGEGEVLPEGEGEVLPEGEGEVIPEGEGEVIPEGEGEVIPEGEGEVIPEGEGEVAAAAINLTKTADRESFSVVGEVITYTIVVTNTGTLPLVNVRVQDPLTGLDQTVALLAPGGSGTFTTTYTVTQADLDAGVVLNTASVSARDPQGQVLGDEAEQDVPAKEPCCSGFDIMDPGNLFLAALALLVLIIASVVCSVTGIDIPVKL